MAASEPLPHFIDEVLRYLHEVHPTQATLDGVHAHDDLLEDCRRSALEAEARALAGYLRRLDDIAIEPLRPIERLEHRMVGSSLRGRMHDIEEVRTWERSPHVYADLLGTSLATQALFAYAPQAERARRVLSKLRQVPRLIDAARENVKEPAGIFVKVGIETMKGVLSFIDRDLPRAFSQVDDLHLLGDLADAQTEASTVIGAYIAELETEVAVKAKASFRLGRERFEQKLKFDEGITISVERLLAIVMRELNETQEAFRSLAGKLAGGDPRQAWAAVKADHPAPGRLAAVGREQLEELRTFLERQAILTVPPGEPLTVAPTPDFYRWAFASMWCPGPFESKPSGAHYYLTDVDRSWSVDRQEEHLREFNYPALWSISIHEVYPGHFLHYQHLRQVTSTARKSLLFAPASFVEGWAHYCEQMMMEAGFRRQDHAVRIGQLAEALIRLVRCVVCIRLHTEDLSVEQGVRLFREEAFMEESSARREAERGTFDPMYLVYSIGKLMLLKLRQDSKQQLGKAFSLRTFHDTLLGQGTAPIWLHRKLLLGDADAGDLLE
jgi:uncharacterized protein (DUF885 family)